jgi:FMN phosphatase YigB (HAD superfamily)
MTKVWLVDFDDTLATGPVTWGYQWALPKFIKLHKLPVDLEELEQSLLIAQEKANETTDLASVLDEFFQMMNWPKSLQRDLLFDVQEHYRPELFEDAKPFLEVLHRARQTVFILSNNPHTLIHARETGLQHLVDDVIIPPMLPEAGPKPDRSLWDKLVERFPMVGAGGATVVGDDPWSDLAFAKTCGLTAWLVDRHNRFANLELAPNAHRVRSLLEIKLS